MRDVVSPDPPPAREVVAPKPKPRRHVHGHDRPTRDVPEGAVTRCCCGAVLVEHFERWSLSFTSEGVAPYNVSSWRRLRPWPFDRRARALADRALR